MTAWMPWKTKTKIGRAARLVLTLAAGWTLAASASLWGARRAETGASASAAVRNQAARDLDDANRRRRRELARHAAQTPPALPSGGGGFVADMNRIAQNGGASLVGARLDEPAIQTSAPSAIPPSSTLVAPPDSGTAKVAPKFQCTVRGTFSQTLTFLDGVAAAPDALQIGALEVSCPNASDGDLHPPVQLLLSGTTAPKSAPPKSSL